MANLDSLQRFGAISSIALSLFGLFLNSSLLGVLASTPLLRNHQNVFGIGLILFDSFSSIVYIVQSILSFANLNLAEHYLTCQSFGFLEFFFTSVSLWCLVAIPTSPFRVIVLDSLPLNKTETVWRCICIAIMGLFIASMPWMWNESYVVGPSGYYCFLDINPRNIPSAILLILITLCYAVPSCILIGIYWKIWDTLKRNRLAVGSIPHMHISQDLSLEMQLQIATRGFLFLCLFVLGYLYPIIYVILSASLVDPLPGLLDIVNSWCIITNIILNPVIYYLTDSRVQVAVDEIWHVGPGEIQERTENGNRNVIMDFILKFSIFPAVSWTLVWSKEKGAWIQGQGDIFEIKSDADITIPRPIYINFYNKR